METKTISAIHNKNDKKGMIKALQKLTHLLEFSQYVSGGIVVTSPGPGRLLITTDLELRTGNNR